MRLFCAGVLGALRREVRRLQASGEYRAVVWWLPLLLILFFAVFFSHEVVGSLPVAVVDEDESYLSRRLVSMLYASHEVAEVEEVPNFAEARERVLSGSVVGIVEIPNGFARKTLSGQPAEVVYYDSGTNISTASLSSKGVQMVATSFGVGVALQRANMRGAMSDEAIAEALPIGFSTYALFNPWLNYAYYVGPCFWAMVLIISAMLSTIYAIGSELRYASSLSWIESAKGSLLAALVGKLAPSTLALWLLSITTAIVVFGLYDTPMRGEWWMLALGCMVLILAYQSVAIFIVALTASFRLSLSLGGGYSVLAFTFSGVTFPTMAMFSAVQPLTYLFPYTYFMKLYIDQAVRGVEWWYSMTDIAAMLLFCLLPILALPRLWRVVTENRFWCRL